VTCTRGSWFGSPTSYAISWIRDGRVVGRGASHLVRAADRGRALHCQVTARNASGARTAASATLHVAPAVKAVSGHRLQR